MKSAEFRRAVELAHERCEARVPMCDLAVFDGCGLPDYRYPVFVKIEQVADLIRWQCFYIFRRPGDDAVDHAELENVQYIARRKFQIVKPDLQECRRCRARARSGQGRWRYFGTGAMP